MLASVELKKRENRDDLDFLQMNGCIPCSTPTFAEPQQCNIPFSTGQLSAFIIQLVTWQALPRSE
jgi:hypothetical protein